MLHKIEFPSDQVRIDGALDLRRTAHGWRPRRLPAWTQPQLPDGFFDLALQAAAGVRLVLQTDATAIDLTLHATRVGLPGSGPLPARLDLFANGERTHREAIVNGDVLRITSADGALQLIPGAAETIRFAALPPWDKEVRIWLPQSAICDLISLSADAAIRPAGPPTDLRWVHYGSSISHCIEADGPGGTWPAVAALAAHLELTDLGFSGNAMLDPFVARTIRDLPADIISLKIGINIVHDATMRRRTFLPAMHGFLDTIRERHPNTPIIVISPISCPALEDCPGPAVTDPATGFIRATGNPDDIQQGALTLSVVRELLEHLVDTRSKTDSLLSYLDGRDLLGPRETADLPDGLHPNTAAYLRMGARFAAWIRNGVW